MKTPGFLTKCSFNRLGKSAGKISITLVVITSMIFGMWLYSGWPRIWPLKELGVNKIRIPPEIKKAEAAVSFVGSCNNVAANGGDVTLTLPSMQQNDLVIVAYSIGDNDNADFNMAMVTTGYTEVVDVTFANDTQDVDLGVYWKVMGATPDTSAQVDGQGGTDAAVAAVCMVFRGVDTTTPMDVTPTTATGINTANADPPSIDHNNPSGVWTVLAGASGHTGGTTVSYTFPSGYTTNKIDDSANDTSDALAGLGYNTSPSDPENPGALTYSGTDSTGFAWAAATLALRPAVVTVSLSVSDGAIAYGGMGENATKDTTPGSLNDEQIVTNDGNVTENFNIRGYNATGGGCTWNLVGGAPPLGTDNYRHRFSTDGGSVWVEASTSFLTFESGVAQNATRDLNLEITMPSSSSCSGTQNVDVTLQAVQQ